MTYGGLIFDFNGVLWWDGHLQEQAWVDVSARLRGRPLSAGEIDLHVHGRNNRYTLEYLVGQSLSQSEVARLSETKETLYRQLCLDQGPAFRLSEGAVELLDDLAARDIPRAIATASGPANVDFFVEHLHLDRWFTPDRTVCDDGRRPGKPAPDIYLEAARRLALDPVRCVVVEDSISGLQAARAAGVGYLVALGPATIEGVDAMIEHLGQLLDHTLFAPGRDAHKVGRAAARDRRRNRA
ncbi:MAG: HAD family phosphatase [Anaerolineae bacterium]|jgi:beta-phosphoglucomutase-like phosphatase (HAD superfamily)